MSCTGIHAKLWKIERGRTTKHLQPAEPEPLKGYIDCKEDREDALAQGFQAVRDSAPVSHPGMHLSLIADITTVSVKTSLEKPLWSMNLVVWESSRGGSDSILGENEILGLVPACFSTDASRARTCGKSISCSCDEWPIQLPSVLVFAFPTRFQPLLRRPSPLKSECDFFVNSNIHLGSSPPRQSLLCPHPHSNTASHRTFVPA